MHSPDKAALREYCPCPQEAEQGLAIWTKNKNKTKPKHINCAAVIISIIGAYSIFFLFLHIILIINVLRNGVIF